MLNFHFLSLGGMKPPDESQPVGKERKKQALSQGADSDLPGTGQPTWPAVKGGGGGQPGRNLSPRRRKQRNSHISPRSHPLAARALPLQLSASGPEPRVLRDFSSDTSDL